MYTLSTHLVPVEYTLRTHCVCVYLTETNKKREPDGSLLGFPLNLAHRQSAHHVQEPFVTVLDLSNLAHRQSLK